MDALSGEVAVDSWWSFLERKILEGIAFKDIKEGESDCFLCSTMDSPSLQRLCCQYRVSKMQHTQSS